MANNVGPNQSLQVCLFSCSITFAHRAAFRTIFEHKNTIRAQYGLTDTRNCAHGSGIYDLSPSTSPFFYVEIDSFETAQREIAFFFPEFDMKSISKYEKLLAKKLTFDEETLEHRLLT